jgi:signal transduction histidine kinase
MVNSDDMPAIKKRLGAGQGPGTWSEFAPARSSVTPLADCIDRMLLRRALSNILSNAIRHTPESGLAIAKSIIGLHGGTINAQAGNGITRFEIRLEAA